ncbi:hypothetical protein SAMN04487785_103199 [Dyella jiangningensis]|uniref:hypothetical protein n=1 Tax=Dyella sp. AtDHG13 TaxID=1938897 RepID=UPI000880602B|nr:hypothetical protein [Dyella sp. AtDHG13]PXV61641.1 hypothetical protein BDW41_101384 [Dyella sp. AtDHG13]SDJ68686.1 hypothetical protein SAMN04487785_103199 [Dyella jiangningensis]
MKRTILTAVVAAVGLACVGQAQATVETYTVDLNGYAVVGFVGNTPEDYARAQQQANSWETQRHLMLKPQSMKAVAIDESQGVALNQTQLRDAIVQAALAKTP